LFTAFAAFVLIALALQFSAPALWLAVFVALFVLFIVIWGISPLLTSHWLTTTRLILRQGWYFRGTFTLREIESMTKLDEDAPLGLRAQIMRRRLYVTGSKVGLLRLKLRRARRFWAVLGAEADVIVFDVESPDTFLESFAGRMASLAPIEPKRADPYLRD